MTTFQTEKRPFVAVDVANIRESRPNRERFVGDDHPLFNPDKEFQHFSLDVVEQFMKDLEALLPESTILYFIDSGVKPTNQNPAEIEKFLKLTQFDGEKAPKVATVKPRHLIKKIKADDVLCELHNKYGAILISIDYFRDEIQSGKIQNLSSLLQFYPVPNWGNVPVFEFRPRRQTLTYTTLEHLVEKSDSGLVRREAMASISKFLKDQKPPKNKKEKLAKKTEPSTKPYPPLVSGDEFARLQKEFEKNNPRPISKRSSHKPKEVPTGNLPEKEDKREAEFQKLLFVFSISKRKKLVGKKVTLIGRLTDKREPETPIIWFGSTTPVFVNVSTIEGLQPGFVRIVGQLNMREDETWSIESIESAVNIDGRNLKSSVSGPSRSDTKNTLKPWGVPPWNRLKLDPHGPEREAELEKLRLAQMERREREEARVAEDIEKERIVTEAQQRERDALAAEELRLRAAEEARAAEDEKLRRQRQATRVADERNRQAYEEAERIRRERDAIAEKERAQKWAATLEQNHRDAAEVTKEQPQIFDEPAQEMEYQGAGRTQRIRAIQTSLLIAGLTVLATALFRIFVG
jgi:hypothetical protein